MGDTSQRLVLLQMFGALRHLLSLHSHSYTVVHCIMAVGGQWILVTLKLHKLMQKQHEDPPPFPSTSSGACTQKCLYLKVF